MTYFTYSTEILRQLQKSLATEIYGENGDDEYLMLTEIFQIISVVVGVIFFFSRCSFH